jgi:hypothetical protein
MRRKMLGLLLLVLGIVALGVAAMQVWRWTDGRAADAAWAQLRARAEAEPLRFEPAMVADLPEPARRYLLHTIAEATPLARVAEIRMRGTFGLGDRVAPNYQPMRARQILVPPHGFVWRLEAAGSGAMRLSGSDGMAGDRSWTRFWVNWTLPVARAGGDADHLRASFGRVAGEAVIWAPAALLPGPGVRWEETGEPDLARVVVSHGGLEQAVDIRVAEDGRPETVVFMRWSDANPEREWRLQPFGARLGEFEDFGGYRLPTRVEAGNHWGTEDYFPFFRAEVEAIAPR